MIESNNRLKRRLRRSSKLAAAADEPSEAAEQVDAAEDKGQPVVRICVIMHVDEVDSPILQRGSANVSAARNIFFASKSRKTSFFRHFSAKKRK